MARATSGSSQVQFGMPNRGKGATTRASAGRMCDHEGCTTLLTTYNSGSSCWLHSSSQFKHPLARG
ncbi:MAG: hypothetical protein M3R21_09125 [Candidatus Dormibacteraeota bacterium]|nr:hypothetical protein [Candidatus Dormibacteraeota bacterium]